MAITARFSFPQIMLILLPSYVPPLSWLLAEVGNPSARELSKALDVTPRTAQRWIASDSAPLACRLALYYVTKYGQSAVACHALNEVQSLRTLVNVLQDDARRRTSDVQRLLAVGNFGTANDPLMAVSPLLSWLPAPVSAAQT